RAAVATQLAARTEPVFLVVLPCIVEHPLGHAGLDQPGAHGVDTDIPLPQIAGRGHGEVDHSGLGGAVGIAAGAGADAGHRGGVDDGAAVLLTHLPGGIFGEQHHPEQVDVDDLLPGFHVLVGGQTVVTPGDAGVV